MKFDDVMTKWSDKAKTCGELIYRIITGHGAGSFAAFLYNQNFFEVISDLYEGGRSWVTDGERESLDGLYNDLIEAKKTIELLAMYKYMGSVYLRSAEVLYAEMLLNDGKRRLTDGEYTEMLDSIETACDGEVEWFNEMLDQCDQTPYVQSLRHVCKMRYADYLKCAKKCLTDMRVLPDDDVWEVYNKEMGDHEFEQFMARWLDYWKDGVKQPMLRGVKR